jgi:hypothetical protein
MKECVGNCEFMKFSDGRFICIYYNSYLTHDYNQTTNSVKVLRCEKCIEDGIIGSNSDIEDVRKLKNYLGWLADSFYSHKDEFEESLTEMYRILKKMEEKHENG